MLIFYAGKHMVLGNSRISQVFNFAMLLKSPKSRKFDACEICIFYSIREICICVLPVGVTYHTELLSFAFYLGLSVLREYAVAAFFTYFSKVHILHVFFCINWHF